LDFSSLKCIADSIVGKEEIREVDDLLGFEHLRADGWFTPFRDVHPFLAPGEDTDEAASARDDGDEDLDDDDEEDEE